MELQDKVYPQKPSSNDWRDLPQIPQKTSKKQPTRKNPWGNRSYADLITQAIQNAPEKKLTLSQIYDWMVKNIPHFKDKGENNSSAGWKNSIRHNLSLHTRFVRVQNDVTGKSSWWIIDPEGGDGRVTRRRPSAKGDRTRTYRRQRSKPKIQQPGTKCVSTQDQALISSSFSQPAHLTGNYTTVSIPPYLPRDPIWHSEWGQRQRWHSSSSCSSEEVILDSSRIFRTLSPEFQQPRSPLSDRNSSGFSSPSSESEPGDAFSISYPAVCSFSAFQDGMGRWITSPESSLEHPRPATLVQGSWDGLNESTSYQWEAKEFPNEILADSNLFPKSNHTVHLSHPHGDPNYDFSTPSSTCSSNYYYTVNTKNDYDSRICSPELPSDSDDMPSPNLYVSSQCAIALIDFYNNPRECEKYNVSPYSYSSSDPEGSLFDHSGKPSCALNAIECLGDDAIPEDLRTCHIHPGIECNVSDVIAHEIEMEGQLMFLDCFKDPVRS